MTECLWLVRGKKIQNIQGCCLFVVLTKMLLNVVCLSNGSEENVVKCFSSLFLRLDWDCYNTLRFGCFPMRIETYLNHSLVYYLVVNWQKQWINELTCYRCQISYLNTDIGKVVSDVTPDGAVTLWSSFFKIDVCGRQRLWSRLFCFCQSGIQTSSGTFWIWNRDFLVRKKK